MGWAPELEWEGEVEGASVQEVGVLGEQIAVEYLEARGWEILDRNVRWREGELDVVASRWEELWGEPVLRVIFVEVKTRRRGGRYAPQDNITPKKQRTVARLAGMWARRRDLGRCAQRLDVIAVVLGEEAPQVVHYEGAFDALGRR
jgi:putative endonuclease